MITPGIASAVQNAAATPTGATATKNVSGQGGFGETLNQKISERSVKISGHAATQLQNRGIPLDGRAIASVDAAIDALASKGGKESLIVLGDSALVVNVSTRTIITAMSKSDMSSRIFTKIDSAIIT